MRLVFALPLIAAALVAGCNQGGSVTAENESAPEVAAKVAATGIKPLPGRWESKVKMESFDMAGMPPQAKEAMAKRAASASTFSTCLTPEQVNQPDGGFFAGGAEGCTYKHFTMAGGKIDAEMTCGKAPYSQDMTMSGTYGETAYAMKVSSKSEVQPGKTMTMSMAIDSRRTGDCDGKEDITEKDVKAMQEFSEKAK